MAPGLCHVPLSATIAVEAGRARVEDAVYFDLPARLIARYLADSALLPDIQEAAQGAADALDGIGGR